MSTSDGSSAAWWASLADHLAARERDDDQPDPWADRILDVPPLTAAQADFLAGLGDQPAPPRVGAAPGTDLVDGAVADDGTGNPPGDSPGGAGVRSSP